MSYYRKLLYFYQRHFIKHYWLRLDENVDVLASPNPLAELIITNYSPIDNAGSRDAPIIFIA